MPSLTELCTHFDPPDHPALPSATFWKKYDAGDYSTASPSNLRLLSNLGSRQPMSMSASGPWRNSIDRKACSTLVQWCMEPSSLSHHREVVLDGEVERFGGHVLRLRLGRCSSCGICNSRSRGWQLRNGRLTAR